MLKDTNYDFGPSIGELKMYSVSHLRSQNPLREHSPEQLVDLLTQEKYSEVSLAQRLASRLKDFKQSTSADRRLLEAIIMEGHGQGLASSPAYSEITDIYWQAAALLLEQYGVDHVNELTQLED